MKFLAVVTPPSIYHGCSTQKKFWEGKFTGYDRRTAVMDLAYFRMLIHELPNKDPDIVPEEAPLIVLDSKSAMCMAKNDKDTKHTRHIARIINFLRNGEKCKIHKIDWCEGGLQLADIATKNVGEHDLTSIMKYIIGRLYN